MLGSGLNCGTAKTELWTGIEVTRFEWRLRKAASGGLTRIQSSAALHHLRIGVSETTIILTKLALNRPLSYMFAIW